MLVVAGVACCLLFVVCCLLFVVCCLLFCGLWLHISVYNNTYNLSKKYPHETHSTIRKYSISQRLDIRTIFIESHRAAQESLASYSTTNSNGTSKLIFIFPRGHNHYKYFSLGTSSIHISSWIRPGGSDR
jgi:hypothetical protein